MKRNELLKNFTRLILIFVLFIIGESLLTHQIYQFQHSFEYSGIYITFITLVFFGGIGVLLGLNRTHFSLNGTKDIKIDKAKLLILGLPSFIVSMSHVLIYLGVFNKLPFIAIYILENNYVTIVSSIILGHTLISSLYKE